MSVVLITGCSSGIGEATADIYAGNVAKFFGGNPDSVVEVVRKAIETKRPRPATP